MGRVNATVPKNRIGPPSEYDPMSTANPSRIAMIIERRQDGAAKTYRERLASLTSAGSSIRQSPAGRVRFARG